MNPQLTILAAGLALSAAASAQVAGTPPGGRGGANGFQQFGATALPGQPIITRSPLHPVTGSPVQATEERRTVQTLGDGTTIERADTNLFYRDSQGRTRIEHTLEGRTTIQIIDPVSRFTASLDASAKTARRTMLPPQAPANGDVAAVWVAVTGAGGRGGALEPIRVEADKLVAERAAVAARTPGQSATEDLGTLSQNGVPAQGTRTTLTIAAGKIGNSRDIHVVNERWYSNELQMVVKSINSDPRFGTTTYQLTNILRANPDASLFQIPSDYTVSEPAGRRGQ